MIGYSSYRRPAGKSVSVTIINSYVCLNIKDEQTDVHAHRRKVLLVGFLALSALPSVAIHGGARTPSPPLRPPPPQAPYSC